MLMMVCDVCLRANVFSSRGNRWPNGFFYIEGIQQYWKSSQVSYQVEYNKLDHTNDIVAFGLS